MKYLLMIYSDETAGDKIPAAEMAGWMDKMMSYRDALTKAGVFVDTVGLARSYEATTVQLINGQLQVHDGPYADTREQFGGYYTIDVPDMATAQKWAAQCPGALWGKVEIRPFAQF